MEDLTIYDIQDPQEDDFGLGYDDSPMQDDDVPLATYGASHEHSHDISADYEEEFDTNGDGINDAIVIGEDTDGDGYIDHTTTYLDTDYDGVIDTAVDEYDTNGDGNTDFKIVMEDTNGDGNIDHVTTLDDGDYNGTIDTVVEEIDSDGDGYLETTHITADTTGDGQADFYKELVDTDGDGEANVIFEKDDTNASGEFDSAIYEVDADGDGIFEHIEHATDYNNDGVADSLRIYDDTTGDGLVDTMTEVYDSDGDGEMDMAVIHYDYDGDGREDWAQSFDYNPRTGEVTPINDQPAYGDIAGTYAYELEQFEPTPDYPAGITGDPATSIELWEYQGESGPCALYSQMFVIEELTGQDINMDEFMHQAEENGWYDGTTTFLNINKMLDYYGVENEMSFHNDITDIEECLAQGGRVIVAIDADEIWYGEGDDLFSPNAHANHAVEVIGIDNSDPEHPMVILNDSGTPYGRGEMVPLEDFMDAWKDSENQMIACYPTA